MQSCEGSWGPKPYCALAESQQPLLLALPYILAHFTRAPSERYKPTLKPSTFISVPKRAVFVDGSYERNIYLMTGREGALSPLAGGPCVRALCD